jgi:hypothetical protein
MAQTSCDDGGACPEAAPLCQGGDCVAACTNGRSPCEGVCVYLGSDPDNCGECGRECDANKLCIDADCREFSTPGDCDACPCAACDGDLDLCCTIGGSPLCLAGLECPDD